MSREKQTENNIEQNQNISTEQASLEKELQNIFTMFYDESLKTGALFIQVFKGNIKSDIDNAKLLINKYTKSKEDAQNIINSLIIISELCLKDENYNRIVSERIKTFVEFQATRDYYNEQSSSKDSPNSFVDRYANRDAENNQGQSTSWCSML